MYPVSDKFMEAVQKNTRTFYWTGSIVTKNHQTYPFGNEDIVKGSGYITRQCCGSTEIELGTVYASEMGISLYSDVDRYTLDGAEIRLSFHLVYEDGSEEEVPMGVFEVSEANRAIRCLELKAYDYMLRFDKSLKLNASSGTAYNFLASACNDCKVELAHSREEIEQMPNGKEVLGIYSDNDIETYRDLLYYTAQVLGCFCRIDREGRLELVSYGTTPVMDIPTTQRFDSSYSDFVTRYTAVSSTNMRTETAEYYALDVDDGLTLNLGVNPLLQFGLKTTRERILRNILDRIVVVDYVPFDSTTIGNPALDPGDILTFSGGHADESKISCITGVTYKVNGKHSLKCVGKNPKLSSAKSRNEKNISGLLNTVEAGKIVVYNFTNVSPFKIGTSPTEVLSITFTSKEETTAQFLAELLLEVTADEVEKKITGTAQYEDAATEDGVTDTTVKKPVTYSFTEKGQAELIRMHALERGFEAVGYNGISQSATGAHAKDYWAESPKFGIGQGKKTARDEMNRLDLQASLNGYWAFGSRLMTMGWPLPEQTKAYEGLVAMRKAALAAVRPGANCADLYAAMLDAAERAGVTPVTGVHWGHGIGVASQEAPWIAPGDATVLKEGMVLVLNPHVQGPGGTILYSRDTVLLDFNGCKILGWYKDWREPYVASDSYYSGGG